MTWWELAQWFLLIMTIGWIIGWPARRRRKRADKAADKELAMYADWQLAVTASARREKNYREAIAYLKEIEHDK